MARRLLFLALVATLLAGCDATRALFNQPPKATLAANPTSGDPPLTVTFSRSASDPDGDTLNCTLNFGDSSAPATGCSGSVTHTYQKAGTYTARFAADDGHGHVTGDSKTITVNQGNPGANQPPIATSDAYSVNEDRTLNVPAPGVLANDRDPDGDILTVSAHTNPSHGTLAIQSDGAFSYTPETHYNGTDAFTYTVSDGHGHSASARVSITVNAGGETNHTPTAQLSADPTSGIAPLTVTFSRSARDQDGDDLTCTLDFGDGSAPASGCSGNVTHTYQNAGTYTARFSVDDGHGHKVTKTAKITVDPNGNGRPAFNIQLVYVNRPTDPAVEQAFEDAAARWAEVITGDLPDVQANIRAGHCGSANGYKGKVDDLLIFVSVKKIDGQWGTLGSAGPCYLRGDSYLPYAGMMKFDSEDLDWMKKDGILKDVILHEMGHVLGIGTLWEASHFDFLRYDEQKDCLDASPVKYAGQHGVNAWHTLGGRGLVPVEDSYNTTQTGGGTDCGHWKEATFDNELMTGMAENGSMPLSKVTIAGLEDLGYQVDYAAADPYRLPSGAKAQGTGFKLNEILIRPQLP